MNKMNGMTFREWLSLPVEKLLEMAVHKEISKEKIDFDQDDIDYLHQFPRRLWSRALRLRYGELLIQALQDRQERRKPQYDHSFKKFYDTQYEKQMKILGGNRYPQGTENWYKIDEKARQIASGVAHRDAEAEVEAMPLLRKTDPRFESGTFEFDEKSGARDNQGHQTKTLIHVPHTGINRLVHRLETTPGHWWMSGEKPGEGADTLVGKLGYYLWNARAGDGRLPGRTGGYLALESDTVAGRKIQQWINAIAEKALKHSPEVEKDIEDHPDQYKFGPDEDQTDKTVGYKEDVPFDRIKAPIEKYFLSLLNTYRENPGDPAMKPVNDVLNNPELTSIRNSPAAQRWPDDQNARGKLAILLTKGYLWMKAKEVHPEYPDTEIAGSKGDMSRQRLLTTVEDKDHLGGTNKRNVYIRLSHDGSISVVNPQVHAIKKKHVIQTVHVDPNTGIRSVKAQEEYHPVLTPGATMVPLPHWLWKKSEDMKQYHNVYAASQTVPSPEDPSGARLEWANESWGTFLESEDSEEEEDDDNGDEDGETQDGKGKGGRKKSADEFKNDNEIRNKMNGVTTHIKETSNRFPLDNAHVKRLNNEEIATYPTYGRYGNYIKLEDHNQIKAKWYAHFLGESLANRIMGLAQDEVNTKRAERDQRTRIPSVESIFIDKAREELANRPGDEGEKSPLKQADEAANYHVDFFKQLASKPSIVGGMHRGQNWKGMKPLVKGSDEWNEEYRKLTEGDTAMKMSSGPVMAWVFDNESANPESDDSVYMPIWRGVTIGLQKAVSMYHPEVAAKLISMANALYNQGFNWVLLNLGDKRITQTKDIKARNFEITKMVAQLVGEIGQLDIAEVGSRRLAGTQGAGHVEMDDSGSGEDGGKTKSEIIANNVINMARQRGENVRGTGARPIKRSITSDSLAQEIEEADKNRQATEDFDKIADPMKFDENIQANWRANFSLYKLLEEKYLMQQKPDGSGPYSESEAKLAAFNELQQRIKKKSSGRATNDGSTDASVFTGNENPAQNNLDDDEKSIQFKKEEEMRKAFEEAKPEFQDPEQLKKIIDNEIFRLGIDELVARDGELSIRKWFQELTDGNEESMKLLEPLLTKAAIKSKTGIPGEDIEDTTPFDRGSKVKFYPGDMHTQKTNIEKLLDHPSENIQKLDNDDLLSSPLIIPAIDRKTIQLRSRSDRSNFKNDLDALTILRGKAAAGQIAPLLNNDQKPNDFIKPLSVDPSVIKKWLKDPLEFKDLLSQDSTLAVHDIKKMIQERIVTMAVSGKHRPSVVKKSLSFLKDLEQRVDSIAAKSTDNIKNVSAQKENTIINADTVRKMLENPTNKKNQDVLLYHPQARFVPGILEIAQDTYKKLNGSGRAVVLKFISLVKHAAQQAEQNPEETNSDRYSPRYYKPVPTGNKKGPFQVTGNPQWKPDEINQIVENDPEMRHGDQSRRDDIASGVFSELPNPPAHSDYSHTEDNYSGRWGLSKYKKVDGLQVPALPQLDIKSIGEFKKWLDLNSIKYEVREVPVSEILPSQEVTSHNMNSQSILKGMMKPADPKPAIAIYDSSKKYVLIDGHQKWASLYGKYIRYHVPVTMPVILVRTDFDTAYNLLKDEWGKTFIAKGQARGRIEKPKIGAEKAYPDTPAPQGASPTPPAVTPTVPVAAPPVATPTPVAATPTPATSAPAFHDMLNDPVTHQQSLMTHPIVKGDEKYQQMRRAVVSHQMAGKTGHASVLNNIVKAIHQQ
jgi:hypothetical protein